MNLQVKRVYEPPGPRDGKRVLVDRLWPRGLRKDDARLDLWLKEIGPSHELRRWFGHDPARWDGFRRRYFDELEANPDTVGRIRALVRQGFKVTLLFSAKDEHHNQAVALREYMLQSARAHREGETS